MSRLEVVQECDHEITALFPELARPEQKALAGLVSGVVLAESVVRSVASAEMPGEAQERSKQRRAQRLLANERLEVARAQRRLVARVLQGRRGRVPLLLDATTTGATAQQAGTTSLILAVGWRGRALPLLWQTWTTDEPGQDWTAARDQMLTTLAALLPCAVTVVLLADRGLSGVPLAQAIQSRGWHYLLRMERTTPLQRPAGPACALGDLAAAPGTQVYLRRVPLTSQAFMTNVVAVWPPESAEPWLLMTNLSPTRERCREYRHRTAEEALFRDLKSLGWHWDESRVRRPERVERLLLVLALATLWMLALGQRVIRRGLRPLLEERSRRCYNAFQLGLRYLRRLCALDQPVPVLLSLCPTRKTVMQ